MTKFMFKISAASLLISAAFLFTACGDNPIEVENEKTLDFSATKIKTALNDFSEERENVNLYRCIQENNEISDAEKREARCKTFIQKYKNKTDISTIIKMVSDTVNYNDKGEYTWQGNPAKYLTTNKLLNITLTEYKQVKSSISATKKIGDPEVRFVVKTYIDGEPADYSPITAIALDTAKVKAWKGKKSVAVQIPRGIDAVDVCPIVTDRNEFADHFENEIVLDDVCVHIKNLGLIDNKKTTEQASSNKMVELKWKWFLYASN